MRRGSGCGDLKANREVLLCPNLGKWSYSACFVFRGALKKKPHTASALWGFFFLAAYTNAGSIFFAWLSGKISSELPLSEPTQTGSYFVWL